MEGRIRGLKIKITDAQAELLKVSKEYFLVIAKDLFEKYPDMEKFSWRQYTPYFNDGDSCQFSANRDQIDVNDVGEYDEVGDESSWMDEARQDIGTLLLNFDDEILEKMFGEGSVVVGRGGTIETEDYAHD